MNNKIKELAISNGIFDSLCDPFDELKNGDCYSSVMIDLEKFSELLIKETMQVVANNLPSKSYVYQDISTAVFKHFDVGPSIKVGSRVQVLSGFNVGAKGTVSYIEPSGKLWVMRDGASSDVFYHPEELVGIKE